MICEECNDTGIIGTDETARYCTCERGEFREYANTFGYKLTEENLNEYRRRASHPMARSESGHSIDDQWNELTEEERAKWRDDNGPGI